MQDFNLLPVTKHTNFTAAYVFSLILCFITLSTTHHILKKQQQNLENKMLYVQQELAINLSAQQVVSPDRNQMWLKRQEFNAELFSSLSRNVAVCFSLIKREQNIIIFQGKSISTIYLANFLKKWTGSKLFSEIQIARLSPNQSGTMSFELRAKLPEEEDQSAP